MISVIIPTLNAQATLGPCLAALIPATLDGVVRQVVIADGGSSDHTAEIADHAGTDLVLSEPGRGQQIRAGIAKSRSPWLLILHADTVLEAGWESEVSTFMHEVDLGRRDKAAAAFRFQLNDTGWLPRIVETAVHLRTTLLRLPFGDQALLIPRRLYDDIGGFKPIPIMEDLDLVRRLGRKRIAVLKARARTSPDRYHRDGYLSRFARNQMCLLMYARGVPLDRIAAYYQPKSIATSDRNAVPEDQERAARTIKPS